MKKVSLIGNILHFVDVGQLHSYGHLYHELDFVFNEDFDPITDGKAISNLFTNCSNLRKLHYECYDDEQDSLALATLHQCQLLEELELLSLNLSEQGQLGNGGDLLTRISRNCTHLRRLHCSCTTLSASNLRDITAMESLKELTFSGCGGLTVSGTAALATMRLLEISIYGPNDDGGLPAATLLSVVESFVGSNISETLESLCVEIYSNTIPIDDVQVANALAFCHQLKSLAVPCGGNTGCVFGANGLRVIATGCPLLADINLDLTASGVHYVGTHFGNLKKCQVKTHSNHEQGVSAVPAGSPPVEELQTLYPAVEWV